MTQTIIPTMETGTLPDGTEIKVGDIIMYDYGPYSGQLTRVVLHGGKLCLESHFMYGDNTAIDHLLKQGTESVFKKMSLVDVYKHCKKNNWDAAKYILRFGKKQESK